MTKIPSMSDTANVTGFTACKPAFYSERRVYGGRVFSVTIRRQDSAVVAWSELEPSTLAQSERGAL